MPNVQFADPRLLGGNLGSIVPAASQGMELYSQIDKAGDEAYSGPIKRRLQQLQLQEAQQKIASLPLEQQLKLAQIAEAQQNAAVPREVIDQITPEDTTQEFQTALDENGQRTGEPEKVVGDLYQIETGTRYGANGVQTPFTRKKLVKDAESRVLEQRRVEDLDQYRTGLVDVQRLKAELTKAKLDNPNYQKLGYGVNEAGHVVYTLRNTKTGEIEHVDSGNAPVQSGLAGAFTAVLGGGTATAQKLTVPAVAAPVAAVGVDADTQALIDGIARNLTSPAQSAPTNFNTLDDAQAAANNGLIKPGQRIIVGGKSGVWQ